LDSENLKSRAAGNKKRFLSVVEKINKMKGPDVDRLFHKLHHEEFTETDCTGCAICCRSLGPRLTSSDIERVSKYLKTGTSDFFKTYLSVDEDNDYVFKSMPCPFLQEDNHCSIYSVRPGACRNYPHTDQKNIRGIVGTCLLNTACCPVVFNIFKKLGNELK
jgi:uncharacterized protein